MKPLPLVMHVCPTCGKTCTAAPAAKVTCVHGNRPERLRPAALCHAYTIVKEPST